LHLAVDAVGIKHSGGATVLVDFLAAAAASEQLSKISVFCSPRDSRDFDFPANSRLIEIEQPAAESSRPGRLWWLARGASVAVKRIGADRFLSMNGCSRALQVPQITFVQQSLIFCPEATRLFPISERSALQTIRWMTRRACLASDVVFVQTPTMKVWVSNQFGIDSSLIQVFEPTASLSLEPVTSSAQVDLLRTVPIGRRLLYVGNEMPYKNVISVARAMPAIREQVPGATLFVTWSDPNALTGSEGVVSCGRLRGAALREAYELADIVVMPSLVETVGLPLLEAMSMARPVLAADRPYARDVCCNSAMYFDPLDSNDFIVKAVEMLRDSDLRCRLGETGNRIVEQRRGSQPYARMVEAAVNAGSAAMQAASSSRRSELRQRARES
jgi:glycosyltransferase involved in cell wall biosynthesis